MKKKTEMTKAERDEMTQYFREAMAYEGTGRKHILTARRMFNQDSPELSIKMLKRAIREGLSNAADGAAYMLIEVQK